MYYSCEIAFSTCPPPRLKPDSFRIGSVKWCKDEKYKVVADKRWERVDVPKPNPGPNQKVRQGPGKKPKHVQNQKAGDASVSESLAAAAAAAAASAAAAGSGSGGAGGGGFENKDTEQHQRDGFGFGMDSCTMTLGMLDGRVGEGGRFRDQGSSRRHDIKSKDKDIKSNPSSYVTLR